jgi:hypothetical protein
MVHFGDGSAAKRAIDNALDPKKRKLFPPT